MTWSSAISLNANSADVAFTFKGGMLPMTVTGKVIRKELKRLAARENEDVT